MGAKRYSLLMDVPQIENGCIIEIGEEMGEGSSEFLENMCDLLNLKFICVDIKKEPRSKIRKENFYSMSGENFLENIFPSMNLKVVGAYLDNFDWSWRPIEQQYRSEPMFIEQSKSYTNAGFYLNNINSSIAHMKQAMLLNNFCVPGSKILFDDTWFDPYQEIFIGKGNAGIYYLLGNEWELTDPIAQKYINTDEGRPIAKLLCANQMHFLLTKK